MRPSSECQLSVATATWQGKELLSKAYSSEG
jgi:hypothetical protein